MPKISAVTTHYILKSIAQHTGIGVETLIAELGVDPVIFESDHAQIESTHLIRLFRYAAGVADDPHLALHIGESIPYQSLGLLGYLLVNTDSVGEMLEKFHRYQKLIGRQMKFHLSETDATYTMAIYLNENPHNPVPRYHAEVHLAALINIIREISGQPVVPDRVDFSFPAPDDLGEYRRIFGTALQFDREENAIVLNKAALKIPIRTSNPSMLHFFEAQAAGILETLEGKSWFARVKHHILQNLGSKSVAIDDVAEALGVSVRTLQYHLKAESKSYREALNAVRKKLANHYVAHTEMEFAAIAVLLDYSEPSAFFRAFRQWNGMTPKAMRDDAPRGSGR